MTILFLGNKRADYCSEVHYWKTFEKMGHDVVFLQESEATGDDIVNATNNNDIAFFFWIHTHGWATKKIDEALSELRKRNIPIVAYHLDLYFGLQRQPQIKDYVTKVDHFFTVDRMMADWLNAFSSTKGHYLPAGCFEDESYIAKPNKEKYPHDIVFTGSRNYHSEWPYRPQLIDWLKETFKERFAHYGGGGLPTLRGHELNVMYASSKIAIGDTLCKNFNYPWYISDRAFEQPCRGAFQIFPYVKGLEFFYNINSEIITYEYGNFSQLKQLIDYYLDHDELRERVRIQGHKRAKASHNYSVRLKQIIETIFSENKR